MTRHWDWDVDAGPDRIDPALLAALDRRLAKGVEKHADAYVTFLQRLIRHPTVSGGETAPEQEDYREAMDACLETVAAQAHHQGMEWRVYDGMAAVAEWSADDARRSLGVAMHLDVVPPNGPWKHDPFGAKILDGELWGRGAQDDKGPVAAVFAALDLLRGLGLEPCHDIRLLLGTLEETEDWPDIDLLLSHEAAPDVTIVPDGAFPVIVGEKGIMTVEWRASWPARNDGFLGLHAGRRANVVPDAATVHWQGGDEATELLREAGFPDVHAAHRPPAAARHDPCLEACFEGTAAHAAFPEDGDNAAIKALHALHNALGGKGAAQFGDFLIQHCSDLKAAGVGAEGIHERMGHTSLNLGRVAMGPTQGIAHVNVRFPIGRKVHDVLERFEAAAERSALDIETLIHGRPQDPIYVSPEDHPRLIHTLQACYEAATGRDPQLASMAGTTYAKAFPLALAFGPQDSSAGEPVLAHQADERVRIDRFLENVRVYALAIAMLAFDLDDVEAAARGEAIKPGSSVAST